MSTDNVDAKNLTLTGAHRSAGVEPHVTIRGDALVIVTQAYGPAGDQLVGISDVSFDGYPAVTLKVVADGREGLVHLSPIHGDSRKAGFTDIPEGTKCRLFCPVSGRPLDPVDRDERADYFAIYLTDRLHRGEHVALSDVWGHYSSHIIDNSELISTWAAAADETTL
jgi:hypothetical protein